MQLGTLELVHLNENELDIFNLKFTLAHLESPGGNTRRESA